MKKPATRLFCLMLAFGLAYLVLLVVPHKAGAGASANAGKLIFTEVSFRDSTNDWVELYVVDGSIDWSGYRIYEGTVEHKAISATLASNLSTGDYIVLHEEAGTDETTDKGANGYWDLYGFTDLNATDLILQIKEPSGSTNRVDVVVYSDNNGSFTSSATEANGAVSDGMWNSYDFSAGDAGAWIDSDEVGTNQTLARYLDPGVAVYADSNSKDDWYHATVSTQGGGSQQTLIDLVSFTAASHAGHILLQWQTASEIDNAGFNLWRASSPTAEYARLNARLIPARGGPAWGASYRYQDSTVSAGTTYAYRLEDVDIHGNSTFYGPVPAAFAEMSNLYLPLLLRRNDRR